MSARKSCSSFGGWGWYLKYDSVCAVIAVCNETSMGRLIKQATALDQQVAAQLVKVEAKDQGANPTA